MRRALDCLCHRNKLSIQGQSHVSKQQARSCAGLGRWGLHHRLRGSGLQRSNGQAQVIEPAHSVDIRPVKACLHFFRAQH